MSAGQHDQVAAGREAWERLRSRDRASWQDWLAIARAIAIGRAASLVVAGCNTPFGRKYTKAMAAWLTDNGLAEIGQQVRWRCLQVLDQLPAIERWLATLDEADRSRLNHPDSVVLRYQRRNEPPRAARPSHRCDRQRAARSAPTGPSQGYGKSVYWPSAHILRGAEGFRRCRSSDVYTIVRAVLETAIRNEADLFELLERPARPAPKPAAKATSQPEMVA